MSFPSLAAGALRDATQHGERAAKEELEGGDEGLSFTAGDAWWMAELECA